MVNHAHPSGTLVACLILPFTEPVAGGSFQIGFAMVGKSMATAAFDLLFTYTPELYPTVLRGAIISYRESIVKLFSEVTLQCLATKNVLFRIFSEFFFCYIQIRYNAQSYSRYKWPKTLWPKS